MSTLKHAVLAASAFALIASAAVAGVPLKGVDVKLGKNPGGSVASRLTDGSGQVDFGVLPPGDYTIEVAADEKRAVHVMVVGARSGVIHRDLAARNLLTGRGVSGGVGALATPTNGKDRLVVTVTGD